jgi:hypothetical protein
VKYPLLMLYTKLHVLHKLHVNGESPNFLQHSAWNRQKCKKLKVSNPNKISKFWNSVSKYFLWKCFWFLTPNLLTLFRDDFRCNVPPVTDEVVSFWPSHNPIHLPSLFVQVRCCHELQFGSHPSTETPQNFLICPEFKPPSGSPQQFLSWRQSSFYCNHAVIILLWPDEPKIP